MRRKIAARLKSRAGESIGETLIALLISSLALLMLAGAISSATRVVTQSKRTMTAYYNEDGNIAARSASVLKGPISLELKDEATTDALPAILYNDIYYYENATFASMPVIAYAANP